MAAASEREQAAADEYLAKRAGEAGAARTGSGIVVLSREEGTGPRPTATDTVRVNYEGALPDGATFDSSSQRGEPATFALDEVIPCWTEVVQTMKVGGRVTVICPPDLAYGSEGRPGVPPNSPLIFDIHLLGIGSTAAPGREGDLKVDPLLQQVA
jgi:FKBP-type peptidyl-prolyl cis-trans isomerase FkpA